MFFTLGVAAVAGVAWAHSKGTLPLPSGLPNLNWKPDRAVTEAPPNVLVVLVRDADSVAAVRRAVSPDRIVAASDEAIALSERRIVASDRDAASELIARAGWVDGQIEILTPGPRDAAAPAPSSSGATTNERDNELNELAKKPTLTEAEAMRALELLY